VGRKVAADTSLWKCCNPDTMAKIEISGPGITCSTSRCAPAARRPWRDRSIDQLAAGQEQMTCEITKLQAVEQYVLYKNSEPPPRPAPAPVPKPVLRPPQALTVR